MQGVGYLRRPQRETDLSRPCRRREEYCLQWLRTHFPVLWVRPVLRQWIPRQGKPHTLSVTTPSATARYNPNDAHEFLVAASDNRVYGWDTRTGGVCQEYNYHLKAVSHVSFYDGGWRFFSTSDDKKILCWGTECRSHKYIADPDMYSIPTCAMHPSQESFAGQSMNNRVVVYSCRMPKVKINKRKGFGGHNTAGYACGLTFSPNGHYTASGDAAGLLVFMGLAEYPDPAQIPGS